MVNFFVAILHKQLMRVGNNFVGNNYLSNFQNRYNFLSMIKSIFKFTVFIVKFNDLKFETSLSVLLRFKYNFIYSKL